MPGQRGLEPAPLCSSGEPLFWENYTVCKPEGLLYVGIGGLIPGVGEAWFFGHPDERRSGLGLHLVHDLPAVPAEEARAGVTDRRIITHDEDDGVWITHDTRSLLAGRVN